MPKYIFQFGNTPDLSREELQAVIFPEKSTKINHQHDQLDLPDDQAAQKLIELLGGTIKISIYLANIDDHSPDNVQATVVNTLLSMEGKVHFAIAEWGRDHLPKINLAQIKDDLSKHGKVTRYIEGSRLGLSASVLLHHPSVVELSIIQTESELILTRTVAIQNIDEWSKRDRDKPYADRKRGMLPPKVARMLVNLGTGNKKSVILDPFCGTGTILAEAISVGHQVVGSDLDLEAVEGTKENLTWLAAEYSLPQNWKVNVEDATKIKSELKFEVIVTEPFLGKPKPTLANLPNVFRGLEKLYLGAFKNWQSLLQPQAKIIILFPKVEISDHKDRKRVFDMSGLIDRLKVLGYTTLSAPILYRRPQAIVQREIYQFVFEGK